MRAPTVAGRRLLPLLLLVIFASQSTHHRLGIAWARLELQAGFKASLDLSISSFQSLLNDSSHTFSLGFLRVNRSQVYVSVVHLPSMQPLWEANANPTGPLTWSMRTELAFTGSLEISDEESGAVWSTKTHGNRVVLLNSSNLQVRKDDQVLWESFDFPTDTLVQSQNFTSKMQLVSSNRMYSMRLGDDFMGLYASFGETKQIYLEHQALQAKAEIVKSRGPIYARLDPSGYLGMYQTEAAPADVQAFRSYRSPVERFLVVRMERDGNLVGYYWDGSEWAVDYMAVSETCDLPSPCGSYGLCLPGDGCSCLNNQTQFLSGRCAGNETGDFCHEKTHGVLTRTGVELPFKELMPFVSTSSWNACTAICERNCSCWGALYSNSSGFCYFVSYPIQTVRSVADENKLGFFKLKVGLKKTRRSWPHLVGGWIVGSGVACLIVALGYWALKKCKPARRSENETAMIFREELGVPSRPGPYQEIGSNTFGPSAIEMCNNNK